jgi:glycosyltransferase involved in cell wall biosynthesis
MANSKSSIWLIQAQENPADSRSLYGRRQWRTNTLAEHLADRGQHVIRWRSAFSHNKKVMLVNGNKLLRHDNYWHQFIDCTSYRRHIGFKRILNHLQLERNFYKVSANLPKPSLIHVGNVPSELAYACVRYGRTVGCPVIVDIRDLWPDIFVDRIPRIFQYLSPFLLKVIKSISFRLKFCLKEATGITAITQPFLDWALGFAGRTQIQSDRVFHMCSPSLDSAHSHVKDNRLNQSFGIKPDDFVASYFGNIGYQSDFDTLLNASRLLQQRFPQFKLILAGNGPQTNSLKNASSDLKNVIFPGWLDGVELLCLLERSNVGLVAFHSISNYINNIPNKFPEYLASSMAIACGLEGEMARLTRQSECGFVYPCGDADALANALGTLMSKPRLLRRMSENAQTLHRKYFDSETIFPAFATHLEYIAETYQK